MPASGTTAGNGRSGLARPVGSGRPAGTGGVVPLSDWSEPIQKCGGDPAAVHRGFVRGYSGVLGSGECGMERIDHQPFWIARHVWSAELFRIDNYPDRHGRGSWRNAGENEFSADDDRLGRDGSGFLAIYFCA